MGPLLVKAMRFLDNLSVLGKQRKQRHVAGESEADKSFTDMLYEGVPDLHTKYMKLI